MCQIRGTRQGILLVIIFLVVPTQDRDYSGVFGTSGRVHYPGIHVCKHDLLGGKIKTDFMLVNFRSRTCRFQTISWHYKLLVWFSR